MQLKAKPSLYSRTTSRMERQWNCKPRAVLLDGETSLQIARWVRTCYYEISHTRSEYIPFGGRLRRDDVRQTSMRKDVQTSPSSLPGHAASLSPPIHLAGYHRRAHDSALTAVEVDS